MSMRTIDGRWRAGLPLAVVALVGIVLGSTWTLHDAARVFAATPTGDSFTIDATSGGSVDASATHNVNDSFQFDVIISAAPDPYNAYQANVSFDPKILAWDGNPPVETNVGGASLCGGGTENPASLYDGCAKSSGTSTATGLAFTWGMKCIGAGTSPLHLLTDAEAGGVAVGTNFALASDTGEPTGDVDASVTCIGTSPPPPPPPNTNEWLPLSRCPVDDPAMLAVDGNTSISYCVAADSASGSIKLGNTTSTTGESNLQFGLTGPSPWVVVPPSGGAILAAPVNVPGGLLGLMCPSLDPLVMSVCNLVTSDALNTVTATVEPAGTPTNFNFNAGLQTGTPIVTLPIKVHLENPLLGSTCYIGSDAAPIVLHPENTDLSASSTAIVRFDADGTPDPAGPLLAINLTGATQGDSQFAVPGTSGCGLAGVLDLAINLKEGLPSASGNNYIVLNDASTAAVTFADPSQYAPHAGQQLADDWHAVFQPNVSPGGCTGDTDCDGCPDSAEPLLVPPTDPRNPWDFYSVPAPALRLDASATRDGGVGITTDVVALLKYAGLTSSSPDYQADNDHNGVPDGLQYDRSVIVTPGQPLRSGPPDGGIGVTTDVMAMLAQTGRTC